MDATVVGALIGVSGGLVGSAFTVAGSVVVSRLGWKRQREDREAQLWTEPRRAAYLRFIHAAQACFDARDDYARTLTEVGAGPLCDDPVMSASLKTEIDQSYDNLRLIAPKSVVEPAGRWLMASAYELPAAAAQNSAGKEWSEAYENLQEAERATRAAMRDNLGTGPEYNLPDPRKEDTTSEPPHRGSGRG